jgi:lysophospholipid acyltransferase
LCFNACSHYYREYHSPDLVWDSAQMILTLKLSSVAINYSDGALSKDKMTPSMLKNHLVDVPPLLPYLSENRANRRRCLCVCRTF